MIQCIAIDDEPLALELISTYCEEVEFIQLQKTFTKTSEALKYMQSNPIDLLFLDIQMPDISGIDFYKNLEDKTMVIFTTAYSEYAVEGFNLNAVDYLLKPYELERFRKAVNRAKEFYDYTAKETNETNYIFVRADYSLIKIDCNDILYIESIDDYLRIHLSGKKPVMTLSTLKAIEDKLPSSNFIRVHRSYIVALNKIESVRGKNIQLPLAEIPISNKYEADFFKAYGKDIY
ncbi:MAG: LytTR family DNA-binding domain-containing protein [Chitinophagales bacterium]